MNEPHPTSDREHQPAKRIRLFDRPVLLIILLFAIWAVLAYCLDRHDQGWWGRHSLGAPIGTALIVFAIHMLLNLQSWARYDRSVQPDHSKRPIDLHRYVIMMWAGMAIIVGGVMLFGWVYDLLTG